MAGEQLGDKTSADDKAAIETASKDWIEWLDSHQDAAKAEIKAKMKEVAAAIQPIVAKRTCKPTPLVACRDGLFSPMMPRTVRLPRRRLSLDGVD